MTIQKSFVVKNGLEVNQKLLVANTATNRVGVGTTQPSYLLDVAGGIGVTDVYAVGFATFTNRLNVGQNGSTLTASGSGGVGIGTDILLSSIALQVNGNQIVTNGSLGIGTTNPSSPLHVQGNVLIDGMSTLGVTSATNISSQNLNVSGISTLQTLNSTSATVTNLSGVGITYTNLVLTGVATVATLNATNVSISGAAATNFTVGNNLYVSGIGTIATGVVTNLSGTNINYTGISTLTDIRNTNINVSGVGTVTTLNSTTGNITTLNSVTGIVTNLSGTNINYTGISTLTNVRSSTLLNTGIATLGTVQISSGIITATTGIVTYYGDGRFLQNIISGVGINTAGGTVGTGATILDFRGSGISTVTVSSGIATININSSQLSAQSLDNVLGVGNTSSLGISVGVVTATTIAIGNTTVIDNNRSLQNITGGAILGIQSSGTLVGAGATVLNFIGVGNTFAYNAGTKTLNIAIQGGSDRLFNLGNTGSAATINLDNGDYITATLNQSTTFTFSVGSLTGVVGFVLQLTNGTGGPFSITWPASVRWPAGITPTRTTTDGKTDLWSFISTNGGTTWLGNLSIVNYTL